MQPLSFVGCENEMDKAKISECTLNSIQSFIIDKLKSQKTKLPKEEGILNFKVNISKNGEVTNVVTLNSLTRGKQIRMAIVKIIKSLPEFIPTKTADKKAVGTNLKLSIPIKIK